MDVRLWHSLQPPPPSEKQDDDAASPFDASNENRSHVDGDDSLVEFVKHQIEHRAKEKGAFAVSHRLAEQLLSSSEKVAERAGERVWERSAEGASQRLAGQLWSASEKAVERVGERSLERVGEAAVERAGERIAEKVGERSLYQAGEKAAERGTKRALEQAIEKAGEGAMERASEKALKRAGERALERAMENASEKTIERAGERALVRATERSGERFVERASEAAIERVGERSTERVLAAIPMKFERIFGISARRIAFRIGQGLTIALPVLGGIFAFYLFRSDYKRWKEEQKIMGNRKLPSFPLVLFYGAGGADLLDAFLHFWIAYGVFAKIGHDMMLLTEHMSMGCAVTSTVCAILGEILSHRQLLKSKTCSAEA